MLGSTRSAHRVMVGIVAVLGFAAAGCGGSSSAASGSGSTASTSPTSDAAPGQSVTVQESEFKIALSRSTFTPGTYTFTTSNVGSDTHALSINGPGVNDVTTGSIDPGSTKSITVTLSKGTYDVWCPVANHKELGMNDMITVT